MNVRKLNKKEERGSILSSFRIWFTGISPCRLNVLKSLLILSILLFIPAESYPQDSESFGVKSIINEVKRKFRLNAQDLRRLVPLIKKENKNVILIYLRFDGDEPDYSAALWDEIIEQRTAFEARLDVDFTNRQKAALRAARTELERRVIGFVVEDYVTFLDKFLELNGLEFEVIDRLLNLEYKKKHQLVVRYLSDPPFLEAELQKLSEKTAYWMEKILSREQWRLYRSLSTENETVVASL